MSKIDLTDPLFDHLNYWIGISECDCHSGYPIGGCLRCDLEEIRTYLQRLVRVSEIKEKLYERLKQVAAREVVPDGPLVKAALRLAEEGE